MSDLSSRSLAHQSLEAFKRGTTLPAESASVPGSITGVGWSDHWSFWQIEVPAVMVTDTAPFRNPGYHRASDTPEKLDYARFAKATMGIAEVIRSLANP